MTKLPQLTDDELLVLKALTPNGRHRDVCEVIGAKSGWQVRPIIENLTALNLIKRVKRGHYEAIRNES